MHTHLSGLNRFAGFKRLVGAGRMVLVGALMLTAATVGAAENWFELGLADLKARQYDAAVEKFTKAIESVPEDFEALNNRGFARIYAGDYEGAIQDCTRSLAINPGSAKGYNNRGFARLFTGEFDNAIADFDQALAINPRYVDAYSNRCLAWTRKAKYAEAIADCTEALHLNPRSAKALYNRGYARDRQGDPGGAMRDYIQALKVNPDYVEVFNNMAWIMATSPDDRLRDGRRAVAYAEKAVGNTPDINFLDTLAAAYAENGRFEEAVAIENRIISLLASARQADAIPLHVKRMNTYEEGRPYREPIAIRPVSAITDLQGELASLDALVFETSVTPAAYLTEEPAPQAGATLPPEAEGPRPMLLAQAQAESPVSVPQAYSQSVQTSPGVPVEITIDAETEGRPLNFEIESVPYQGSLQGTLPHLLYTPRPGFQGQDRFTFRAHNAVGPSNLATVTITVAEPAPAAEEATAASEATDEAPVPEEAPPPSAPAPIEETPIVAPEPAPPAPAPAPAAEASAADTPPDSPPAAETAVPSPVSPPETETQTASTSPAPPPTAAPAAEPMPEAIPPGEPSPEDGFTIQVRSVKDAAGATAIVAKLRAEGLAAFSHPMEVPEKGLWHRVFIDWYATKDAARDALDQLDPERFKGAFVRRMPAGTMPPPPAASAPPVEAAPAPEPPAAPVETPPTAKEPDPRPAEPPPSGPVSDTEPGPQAIVVAASRYPYAYQVKSYQRREEAFQLGVELTTLGHTAYIGRGAMGSTGVWYRVYIGCYQTPEEAEKSRTEIAREGFPEAFLTPIGFTIAVHPDASDPAGESLENRLMASGFLPYRLPETNPAGAPAVLVGGFRDAEDATQVLAALEQSGFKGEIRPR